MTDIRRKEYDGRSIAYLPGSKALVTMDQPSSGSQDIIHPQEADRKKTGHYRLKGAIPWGVNNQFPNEVQNDLRTSTVAKRVLGDRAKIHVGAGLFYYVTEIDQDNKRIKIPLSIPEIDDFLEMNDVFETQRQIVLDLETYANAFPVLLPSKDSKQKKIKGYSRHKAIHCRYKALDNPNAVKPTQVLVSYSWDGFGPSHRTENSVVEINILDKNNYDFSKQVIQPLVYASPDDIIFYELAVWDSIRQNKWMDIDRIVPELKRDLFQNQILLKYHIKIPEEYWRGKFGEKVWGELTKKQRQEAEDEELRNMDAFLSDKKNSGKSIITWYGKSEDGKTLDGVMIEAIPNKLKSEDYLPDAEAAYSAICFAMGLDPTLIGAGLVDKRSSGGSGSDKRESLANVQSLMPADRFTSLKPLRTITMLNRWNETYFKETGGRRIQWGYLDSDTSHTLDQKKPKAGEDGTQKVKDEIHNG